MKPSAIMLFMSAINWTQIMLLLAYTNQLRSPYNYTCYNRVEPHYYVAITKFESLLLSRWT